MCQDLIKNPFVCVLIALFALLIILGIIRLFQPNFTMGAEIGAHFGSIDGKIKLEAYENERHHGEEHHQEHHQEHHDNNPALSRIHEMQEEHRNLESFNVIPDELRNSLLWSN